MCHWQQSEESSTLDINVSKHAGDLSIEEYPSLRSRMTEAFFYFFRTPMVTTPARARRLNLKKKFNLINHSLFNLINFNPILAF
jgi:hypothetical protein